MEFYRRKQNTVAVRHVSDDRIVAMVEVVSPGNKASRHALRSFVEKAAQLLDRRVHLLILDLLPPGRRDPHGIHAAIWEEIANEECDLPADKPLTLAAYETALTVRYYVEPVAVDDVLPDMPLFLEPGRARPRSLGSDVPGRLRRRSPPLAPRAGGAGVLIRFAAGSRQRPEENSGGSHSGATRPARQAGH